MKTLTALGLFTLTCTPAFASIPQRALDYDALAHHVLRRAGMEDADSRTFDFHQFMDTAFVRADIGLYEVYFPTESLKNKRSREDYQELCQRLLEAQQQWLAWLEPATGGSRQIAADTKTLTRWIADWDLRPVEADEPHQVRDLLEASAKVAKASTNLREYMVAGTALGLAREGGHAEPIVLVPDRSQFVELTCFAGWLLPNHQGTYWQDGIRNWTNFYMTFDRMYKFLALEFANPGGPAGSYGSGIRMDSRTPTGLAQQVVQLAGNSLFDNYYGDRLPPALVGALAVNLVTDIYGECNTRVDGDLRGRRTSAREVFVPGGNPNGGILPPNLADSRWRARHGADHFVGVLRQAQKAGGSDRKRGSKNKTRYFQLLDDHQSNPTLIHAPFLGTASTYEAPSVDYYGDGLEFFRAYRSCFIWWLQHEGMSSKKKSSSAFAAMLQALASTSSEFGFEEIVSSSYGDIPLSSAELDRKKDLEGRFIYWLSRRR